METPDPRAALTDASVATRCAGARDLARWGTLDDLETLIDLAWSDRSMAVRLYAAAAAADLAQRFRRDMSDEARAGLVQHAFRGDPGHSPSMIMLAAYAPLSRVLPRLHRVLRDPRSDVRLAAVAAMRRAAMGSGPARHGVGEALAEWLQEGRIPADAKVEIARLAGEIGYEHLRSAVRELQGGSEAAAEIAAQALARLDARRSPGTWEGLWWSDGREIYENRDADAPIQVAVCDGERWFGASGTRERTSDAEGRIALDGAAASLVFATPLGAHEACPAVQVDGLVWWQVSEEGFSSFLDAHHEALRALPQAGRDRIVARGEALGGAAAERVRAAAAWIAGALEDCLEAADAQLARKRARGDAWFWRARALRERGDLESAAEALDTFLDKAKRDHALYPVAEALRVAGGS